MSEYKRWKHVAWALVFMAACTADAGDEVAEEESDHAHDEDAEPAHAADHTSVQDGETSPSPAADGVESPQIRA